MFTCPLGHSSTTDDFCDRCGRPIGRVGAAPGPSGTNVGARTGATAWPGTGSTSPAGDALGGGPDGEGPSVCGRCQAALTGRFCEYCGQDSLARIVRPAAGAGQGLEPGTSSDDPPSDAEPGPAAGEPAGGGPDWWVLVLADRSYFDSVQAMEGPDAMEVSFPDDPVERGVPLEGDQVLIGRRLGGEEGIDLSEDVGVSHAHARLLAQPGGTWAVEDLDSTNGTRLNNHTQLLDTRTRVPLGDGDQLFLGAWTRLTLCRRHLG